MPAPRQALLLLIGAAGAPGCYVTERYLIDEARLAQVAALPAPERAAVAVPAIRKQDGRAVYVRADALPDSVAPAVAAGAAPADTAPPPVLVTTRRYSPMVTAGAILTYIGSVASVAGTIGFFVGDGSISTAFGLLALAAEPPMWVGSVLWPLGLYRRPQEARPGQPTLRYLEPGAVSQPPPIAGVRF